MLSFSSEVLAMLSAESPCSEPIYQTLTSHCPSPVKGTLLTHSDPLGKYHRAAVFPKLSYVTACKESDNVYVVHGTKGCPGVK